MSDAEKDRDSESLPVLGEADATNERHWYAHGLRFGCTKCGNCCTGAPGYVWVTQEDMKRIAALLGMAFDTFTEQYVRRVGSRYSLKERDDYDCVFLRREEGGVTGCAVYGVRPMQCRTWPFWSENLKSPATWREASERCPGMCDADAPRHSVEQIEAYRRHPETPGPSAR